MLYDEEEERRWKYLLAFITNFVTVFLPSPSPPPKGLKCRIINDCEPCPLKALPQTALPANKKRTQKPCNIATF